MPTLDRAKAMADGPNDLETELEAT